MNTTETLKDWTITVREILFGRWQYTATRAGEFYTGLVDAVGKDEAMCKALEEVEE